MVGVMDDELRKAERAWRKDRDDDTALVYLSALSRTGDLAFQLMRRLCRESLALAEDPSWDRVVSWWIAEPPPVSPAPPPGARTTRRRNPQGASGQLLMPLTVTTSPQVRVQAARPPRLPDPSAPNNRGYDWRWLCASCRCGHYRGSHVGHQERVGCDYCRCARFVPEIHLGPCRTTGCTGDPMPGYDRCQRHVPAAFPEQPR
jgi:hypothetical protein